MIYNVLNENIGTTDKDGQWSATVVVGGGADTMLGRLDAAVDATADVVTLADAQAALTDLYPYIGAQAKLVYDNDDLAKAIGITEVASVFLTGEFNSGTEFEADGVKYAVDNTDAFKLMENGVVKNASVTSKSALVETDTEYTLAVKVSGKKITEIYSLNAWVATTTDQIVASDITKLEKTDKLLTYTFAKDNNGEIDTTKFEILGADSLADIKVDDVVTIYRDGTNIIKIEVCDDVVTGVVTQIKDSKYTVNGVAYEATCDMSTVKAGNEVTLTLDYAGKIFKCEAPETVSNYAIVMNAQAGVAASAGTIDAKDAKVILYTAEGEKTYVVDTTKVTSFNSAPANYVGRLVEFNVQNDKIIALDLVMTGTDVNTATKITKAGYLDSVEIANDVVVFTTDKTIAVGGSGSIYVNDLAVVKAEDLGVATKDALLGMELTAGSAAYVVESNEIVAIVIPETVVSGDAVYGIVTSDVYKIEKDGKEVSVIDLLVGSTAMTAVKYEGSPVKGDLFEVTTKTDGTVVLNDTLTELDTDSVTTDAANDYVTVKNTNGTNKIKFSDNGADEATIGQLDDSVVVYTIDENDVVAVGDASDLEIVGAGKTVEVFKCNVNTHDDYELITFVIVQ